MLVDLMYKKMNKGKSYYFYSDLVPLYFFVLICMIFQNVERDDKQEKHNEATRL